LKNLSLHERLILKSILTAVSLEVVDLMCMVSLNAEELLCYQDRLCTMELVGQL